jgi:hypothetical protein
LSLIVSPSTTICAAAGVARNADSDASRPPIPI